MTGAFVAVVGGSGAGKDTLLAALRRRHGEAGRIRFARRVVTRASGGNEDHDSLSPQGFDAAEAAGAFLLSWRAHGLSYGIPAIVADDVGAGHIVLANLSRSAVEAARRCLPRVFVAVIDAPPDVRAARLAGRGREAGAEIHARIAREPPAPEGPGVFVIDNGGALADALAAFDDHLARIAAGLAQ